eukprot:141800-Pleurochrysis_carterae.AAC.1
MARNRKQTAMLLTHMLVGVCGIGIIWLLNREKRAAGPEYEEYEYKKENRGTKANLKASNRIRQRQLIQQRIRRWNKTRKGKYDGKDRMKYRQKIRASKRWLERRGTTEAQEANTRESRKRGRQKREKDKRRRGGSGGGGRARA